ncbi:MAG: mandelate racemase/muconate lactonizing enzyme family protein [Rhodobacteraceae bacterium]|nr:mandelate racemase/muconate lactonizing enzyme family protein [Paracoccaceae bacterium]PHR54983.1 MAG: enolase [Robiginitomaculum sp.]
MQIEAIKCAMIGGHSVVRIVASNGVDGIGVAEHHKGTIAQQVLAFRKVLIGMDPTNVERCMRKIRQRGAFKPWGAAVSATEVALWDLAGKAAGLPVHKLLGGKVRDDVRVYNGAKRPPLTDYSPRDYAANCAAIVSYPEGFTIVKQPVAFHGPMKAEISDFYYGTVQTNAYPGTIESGMLTAKGFDHLVACVAAMRAELGPDIGLALDCGPGFTPKDAVRFARAIEQYNILWLEDLVAGDYAPYTRADVFRDICQASPIPIHTGEQIYLRHGFKDLIETRAVDIVGPDPLDVGGIAELKWIAEYADMHGIMIAPHGTGNGLIGLAVLTQVCATLPDNFIAFECPDAHEPLWYDILDGIDDFTIKNSHVHVPDTPGLGVRFNVAKAAAHLAPDDKDFFT